jgi:hypothetical protein
VTGITATVLSESPCFRKAGKALGAEPEDAVRRSRLAWAAPVQNSGAQGRRCIRWERGFSRIGNRIAAIVLFAPVLALRDIQAFQAGAGGDERATREAHAPVHPIHLADVQMRSEKIVPPAS